MEILGFILIIAGIFFFYKKMSSVAESEHVNVDNIIKNYKNTERKFIDTRTLGKAVGVDAATYYKRFAPNADFLGRFANGALVGGGSGGMLQVQSIVGGAVSAYNAGRLSAGVAYGGLHFAEQDRELIDGITKLLAQGKLNQNEFIKAAASIAFRNGDAIVTGERDTFGELIFNDEKERLISAMIGQFFYEHTIPLEKVKLLIEKNSVSNNS